MQNNLKGCLKIQNNCSDIIPERREGNKNAMLKNFVRHVPVIWECF